MWHALILVAISILCLWAYLKHISKKQKMRIAIEKQQKKERASRELAEFNLRRFQEQDSLNFVGIFILWQERAQGNYVTYKAKWKYAVSKNTDGLYFSARMANTGVEHRDLPDLLNRFERVESVCIGGGWIEIDEHKKSMKLYGTSQLFGNEPDREKTIRALEKKFPDWYIVEEYPAT